MAFKIADVLEMLSDGKWHALQTVRRRMKLDRDQSQQIVQFLEEYEFVMFDSTKTRIRIRDEVREFLVKEAIS